MKTISMILCASLLIVGIAVVHLSHQVRDLSDQNVAMGARWTAHAAQPAKDATDSAEQNIAGARAAMAYTTTSTPIASTPQEYGQYLGNGVTLPQSEALERLMSTPDGQQLQQIWIRQQLAEAFPRLEMDMALSSSNAEAVLDLLTKRRAVLSLDFMTDKSRNPENPAVTAMLARNRAASRMELDAELATLLGDQHPRWADYEASALQRQQQAYVRAENDAMRYAITANNNPLANTQFDALTSSLTAEQRCIDQETLLLTMQQKVRRLPETNRRLTAIAAQHLNSQQLELYRSYLEQQQQTLIALSERGVFSND